ncbi:MAG: AAA family ATPase [Sulfurimonas sp.]|nr:AAA family ATPase [Sulfurimonas sp.]
MKIKDIHIDDYKVFKNFDISFSDSNNEPLDLIVLAGINGSGKTTLFEFILDKFKYMSSKLNGNINAYIEELGGDVNIKEEIYDLLEKTYGLAKAMKNSGVFEEKIIYIKAQEQKTEDIKKEILKYIDTLVFEKELSAKEAYKTLTDTIDDIFDGLDIQVEFSGIDRDKNIFFTNELNEKISIDDLSTGEKELLSKIFYLYISDIKDSIILIDEPEISLHPSWQNKIVKIYKNFAKQNNNQIIIATHSPQIVASTPNENLRILVKQGSNIKSFSPDAYGMNVNKALTDIMGVTELRDVEVQKQYDKVKNMILNNEFKSDEFKKELTILETMMQNDIIDFGLLKLELLKRETNDSGN